MSPKSKFISFKKATRLAKSFSLKNKAEWVNLAKSKLIKYNLPRNPRLVYQDEWVGWAHFLGTNNFSPYVRAKGFLSYTKSRSLMRALKLSSKTEFQNWTQNKIKISKGNIKLPIFPLSELPKDPERFYKNNGWITFQDFLGNKNKAFYQNKTRAFDKAFLWMRETNKAKGLIKTKMDFKDYVLSSNKYKDFKIIKSGKFKGLKVKPENISNDPEDVYSDKWRDWNYFLVWIKPKLEPIQYLSYKKAKVFARSLKLKNQVEWREYSKSSTKYKKLNDKLKVIPKGEFKGKPVRPINIPRAVYFYYKSKNDIDFSWGDFLGTKNIQNHRKQFRSFKEARRFVRSLKFRNQNEWKAYSKSGKKPKDIPSAVDRTYKKEFKGYGDFLGSGNVHFSKVKRVMKPSD